MNELLVITDFKKTSNLSEENWHKLFEITRDVKKRDYETEEEWQEKQEWWFNFLESGFGPCVNCGKPAWVKVFDMVEVTKPGDRVVNAAFIESTNGRVSFAFCPEHKRESIMIRRDGTHEGAKCLT